MRIGARPNSGCGTIASPSPACSCIWSAARRCACVTKTAGAERGGWKRRARFPSLCSMRSTIWTEFWRSTEPSTGTASAPAKNMRGDSEPPHESRDGRAAAAGLSDCNRPDRADRVPAAGLRAYAGIRVGRRLAPGGGAVHQSRYAALSGLLLPADAAKRLLERRLDAPVWSHLAYAACRGCADDHAGGAADGGLSVAPLPGSRLAVADGDHRNMRVRSECPGCRIRAHRTGLWAVPVPDRDRLSVHGGGGGPRTAMARRRGRLAGVCRGELFAVDDASRSGAAALDAGLQSRREPMGEAGSLRRGWRGDLCAARMAVRAGTAAGDFQRAPL